MLYGDFWHEHGPSESVQLQSTSRKSVNLERTVRWKNRGTEAKRGGLGYQRKKQKRKGRGSRQREEINAILAGILLFGELQLQQADGEEQCEVKNTPRLEDIEFLFSIRSRRALALTVTFQVSRYRNKYILGSLAFSKCLIDTTYTLSKSAF